MTGKKSQLTKWMISLYWDKCVGGVPWETIDKCVGGVPWETIDKCVGGVP